jgi:peroxiredoxin
MNRTRQSRCFHLTCLIAAAAFLFPAPNLCAQNQPPVRSDRENLIVGQLRRLRGMSDSERASATKRLALQIRQLPVTTNKGRLAVQLAHLSTEGDPGHDTLQEVATTLAQALREQPVEEQRDQPAAPYITLAQLVRYEHVEAVDSPRLAAAMAKLEADEQRRQHANFTLKDLDGKDWTLKNLPGKVVLLNFWATWCPPCRAEMPDLEELYGRFQQRGLMVLAVTNEEPDKVRPFIQERHFSYPVLLDPGGKVTALFRIEGIPKSFVYDRNGKLVAQAIDMRTRSQFLKMLAQAGLE